MENNMVLKYETPLMEGIIERRKSQFTIDVVIDNEVVSLPNNWKDWEY